MHVLHTPRTAGKAVIKLISLIRVVPPGYNQQQGGLVTPKCLQAVLSCGVGLFWLRLNSIVTEHAAGCTLESASTWLPPFCPFKSSLGLLKAC